jgi:chromosomal replication initiation ATPase DnaA
MSREPRQLVLDLAHRSALGAEDFLVSGSNEEAVAEIDRWPAWANRAVLVAGPAGAGKSHLVNVWRQRSGAGSLAARDLDERAIVALGGAAALAVEDIDRGIGDERVLFHLLNLTREARLSLLLTARSLPGQIEIRLPDLRSRLRAMPVVRISDPDESLLRGLLVKLFADRQLAVEPHVIAHIALHMERSMQAASAIVAEVDALALASRRRVTRTLAAEAMTRVRERRG